MSWRKEDGQSTVEFALVLPILILLIFGMMDFGWLFYNKIAINNASREGARYEVVHRSDEYYSEDNTKAHIRNFVSDVDITISTATSADGNGEDITVTVEKEVAVLTGVSQVFLGESVEIQASCTMRKE